MRCYFHLVNSHDVIPDDTGIEVQDVAAAHGSALRAIEEFRADAAECDWQGWRLDVADLTGSVIVSIPLESARH